MSGPYSIRSGRMLCPLRQNRCCSRAVSSSGRAGRTQKSSKRSSRRSSSPTCSARMTRSSGLKGTSRRRTWRQKATAAVMSSPATTTAPDHPSPLLAAAPSRSPKASGPDTARCPRPAVCSARVTSAGRSSGKQRRASISAASQQGQIAVELELGHLGLVVVPLGPLVADEPFEDVLAERGGQQLGALHLVDSIVQAGRERLDALEGQFLVGEREEVGVGLGGGVVALPDA